MVLACTNKAWWWRRVVRDVTSLKSQIRLIFLWVTVCCWFGICDEKSNSSLSSDRRAQPNNNKVSPKKFPNATLLVALKLWPAQKLTERAYCCTSNGNWQRQTPMHAPLNDQIHVHRKTRRKCYYVRQCFDPFQTLFLKQNCITITFSKLLLIDICRYFMNVFTKPIHLAYVTFE